MNLRVTDNSKSVTYTVYKDLQRAQHAEFEPGHLVRRYQVPLERH